MNSIVDTTYDKALRAVESCIRDVGFWASGLPGGYESIWARDSMITSLGASTVGSESENTESFQKIRKKFKEAFKKSIETLSEHQTELGQIPNNVGSWNEERQSDITYNTIDSNLLYIIGHNTYVKAYNDNTLLQKYDRNIKKALLWLQYQDPNEDKLLVQLPTTDWQDAFPHKYGHTINTQALYYGVLKILNKNREAEHIKQVVNGETKKYLSLYDEEKGFYLPFAWKTHGPEYREQGNWFDTLGNLLAIITGLATPKITNEILDYIKKEEIAKPFPCRSVHPPIKPGDEFWFDYYKASDAGEPYAYLNGGVWPYIGGFYVAALVKAGRQEEAEKELENLAKANMLPQKKSDGTIEKHGFHEWIHGQTGKPGPNSNTYQGWSCGMYLFAYECIKRKEVPYF
ncbi:MAG: hypothetical protein COV29_02845 [Candidatus Yanofskybacteria bacterium CG10_big_fil_rev_8_21_14_0_10_36_16]|uniref:beta-fructofuranosidase n=1 Tax=Candidatus Yanofskybacteria bacterium CG10_big_fil_rev_8_21_14_0_10_36_16 TaxID=1975096 RepID=A0A2J0Q7X6_9BACT|nr:MAG: hypothetical protein COV29_02845 [Candidatus Yanofskybacteria bacterium CG10_big_fil_rev_8_21_14_0_10_36_16]